MAMMSARKVRELQAILVELSYTVVYKDKISLRLHPRFFPEVVLSFPIRGYFPYFPKPCSGRTEQRLHMLDACKAILL